MRLKIEQDWHVGDVVKINHPKYNNTTTITKCGYDGLAKEWIYYYVNAFYEEEWTTRHFITSVKPKPKPKPNTNMIDTYGTQMYNRGLSNGAGLRANELEWQTYDEWEQELKNNNG